MITKAKQRDDKRLGRVFEALSPDDKKTLLAFAEFLLLRAGDAADADEQGPVEPLRVDPQPGESVVAAIKRLSKSYSMLDRGKMLNDTSTLMSAHVLQGRPREVVIKELEALFRRCYQDYLEAFRR